MTERPDNLKTRQRPKLGIALDTMYLQASRPARLSQLMNKHQNYGTVSALVGAPRPLLANPEGTQAATANR